MNKIIAVVRYVKQMGPYERCVETSTRVVEGSDSIDRIVGWAMRVSGDTHPQLTITIERE